MHMPFVITFRLIFMTMTYTDRDTCVYFYQSIKTRNPWNQINNFLTDVSTRKTAVSPLTCAEFGVFTQCAQHNCHQCNKGKTKLEQHMGLTMKSLFFLFYFLPHLLIVFPFFFLSFQCMANLQFVDRVAW